MKYIIEGTTLEEIAEAIREKTGESDAIAVPDMAEKIGGIEAGSGGGDGDWDDGYTVGYDEGYGNGYDDGLADGYDVGHEDGYASGESAAIDTLTPLEATENGDYSPPEGSIGFSSVKVNVSAVSGDNKLPQMVDGSITEIIASDLQGAEKIKDNVFEGYKTLISVEIPPSVGSIGSCAFKNCTALSAVSFAENSQLTSIGYEAFYGCSSLASIVIPPSATVITNRSFYSCKGLTSITIPFVGMNLNGTTNTHFGIIFGASSYSDHGTVVPASLKNVTVTSCASITDRAFYGCTMLTNVNLAENDKLITIGVAAFNGCSGLQSITIPSNVTSIGSAAFYNCTSLKSVTVKATTPPTIQSNTFESVPSDCVYKVPPASIATYKSATNWSSIASQIVEDDEASDTTGGWILTTINGAEHSLYISDGYLRCSDDEIYYIDSEDGWWEIQADTPFDLIELDMSKSYTVCFDGDSSEVAELNYVEV